MNAIDRWWKWVSDSRNFDIFGGRVTLPPLTDAEAAEMDMAVVHDDWRKALGQHVGDPSRSASRLR